MNNNKNCFPDNQTSNKTFDNKHSRELDISDLFFELTQKISTKYDIDKGLLVLRRRKSDSLSAVSMWSNGDLRDGLSIKLPVESSLFEQVAAQGQVYSEEYCGAFSGNFFERKLLIDDCSKSFVLQPLNYDGEVIGLLGYSSKNPTAFATFEEGELDKVAADFAKTIWKKIDRI